MPTLQTTHLTIRPFTRDLMLAAIDDPAAAGALLALDVAAGWPNDDESGALAFLAEELARDPALAEWGMHLFIQREAGIIIGTSGFKGRPLPGGSVEIGYGIAPDYQGYGYATEGVRALVDWALAQPIVTRVIADCFPDNHRSARVLTKVGFQQLPSSGGYLNWEVRRTAPRRAEPPRA